MPPTFRGLFRGPHDHAHTALTHVDPKECVSSAASRTPAAHVTPSRSLTAVTSWASSASAHGPSECLAHVLTTVILYQSRGQRFWASEMSPNECWNVLWRHHGSTLRKAAWTRYFSTRTMHISLVTRKMSVHYKLSPTNI